MTEPLRPTSHRWLPDEAPPEGKRAALHRLAAAIRETIELMMETGLPEEEIAAAAADIERFNALLAAGPRDRPLWGFAERSTSGASSGFYDNSPISGPGNPIAPPLSLRIEDGATVARATFGLAYEGPPGHVHGGHVAAAFDEVLGMVQSMTGNPGMTGTLVVRYRRPTPLYKELTFRGAVDRVEDRKIYTTATLHDGETLLAEAEGLFIAVGQDRFRQLAEETERSMAPAPA
ncbi:MAG: PaaI family thioesterase [Dehalococcoidia bacterium]